jgi:hypothetical protein
MSEGKAEGKVKVEKARPREEWGMGSLDLVNKNPFRFHRAKATCLIRSLSGAVGS